MQRILGRHQVFRAGKMKESTDYCYDVPFLQSLQALLKNESVLEQVSFVCTLLLIIIL